VSLGYPNSARDAYARLASGPCPPLGALCFALSGIFATEPPQEDGEFQLDELGRRLFGSSNADPLAAAQRIAGVLGANPGFMADEARPEGLQLDTVLEERTGHPLLLAVIAAEAGRRAGLKTGVFTSPDAWYAGLIAQGTLWLVDITGGHPDPDREHCRGHCGHELAFAILCGLEHRYERAGDEPRAALARHLRLDLRFDHGLGGRATAQGDPLAALWPRR
jgi:hypothetical protein